MVTIPVIDESGFAGADDGMALPVRRLTDGVARLEISNLDRSDPPQYGAGKVPRATAFNANVLTLSADPGMPPIQVRCRVSGFAPASSPIYWRLQTLHVPARFFNKANSHYVSRVAYLAGEWTGRSGAASFELFAPGSPPSSLVYDNLDGRVAGGHAILTVAARAPSGGWLQDFVHLRIAGANPSKAAIRQLVKTTVAGRGAPPFEAMLNAIFAWEADSTQFKASRQSQNYYGPDGHKVLFDWPDDPPNFPIASFDFGVGISQFTKPAKLTTAFGWDWRANIGAGANVFFAALAGTYTKGIKWDAWALAAWERYNGSGAKAVAYAKRLADSPDGKTVPKTAVPGSFDLAKATKALTFPPPPAGKWPVGKSATAQLAAQALADAGREQSVRLIARAASRLARDAETLAWMWPTVMADLQAQREGVATHVLPGLDATDLGRAVAGLDREGIEALGDRCFSAAWAMLSDDDTKGMAPAPMTIDEEWQALLPFVRRNIGNGKIAAWADIRDLVLSSFGALKKPELGIERINAYYGGFVDGAFKPGGATMKVHAEMKARMAASSTLLTAKGSAGKLALVAGIGGFNIRRNVNNPSVLSNHSFGIAIDVDASLNPNMAMKPAELAAWRDLVAFLTGVDVYGAESTRLKTRRTYDKSLPDVTALCDASRAYVAANKTLGALAASVREGFKRLLGLTISLTDSQSVVALAMPPTPDRPGLLARLAALKVPSGKRAAMADRLIYGCQVFTLVQDATLKPAITGTAATTARHGFLNLPAEVIAGLISTDGGRLNWLGSTNGTKDYMHFDLYAAEHPPLY